MEIDILISSCSRPKLLAKSLATFKEKISTTNHHFRYVLIEDYVDDIARRESGLNWIKNNNDMFDEIHILEKKAGFGYHWQEAIKVCKSKYHFHLEDDQEFLLNVNIDNLVEVLASNRDIIQVLFRRSLNQNRKENNPRQVMLNGVELTEVDVMSDSIGVYNTEMVKTLIDNAGWSQQLHEFGVLTPLTATLGFRKTVLGYNDIHYTHVGQLAEYRQGGYVDE